MVNIIVALPKQEECTGIRNILARNGYRSLYVCNTGAQAISQAEDYENGIVICGYKLPDMVYSYLKENLPSGFEMLILTSPKFINECYGNDIVCLTMPLKLEDFISTVNMMAEELERRRRRARLAPKVRNEKDIQLISEAKELLMARNHMTEDEAHRYIQKNSMDSGNSLVETAKMILTLMRN